MDNKLQESIDQEEQLEGKLTLLLITIGTIGLLIAAIGDLLESLAMQSFGLFALAISGGILFLIALSFWESFTKWIWMVTSIGLSLFFSVYALHILELF